METSKTESSAPFSPQTMTPEQLAEYFETDLKTGLSEKTVKSRQKQYGKNILRKEVNLTFTDSLRNQIKSISYLLLFLSSLILYLFDPQTPYLLLVFAIPVLMVLGAFIDSRATTLLNRLNLSTSLTVTVIRDGEEVNINNRFLVPGDIIWLAKDQVVPADCRILSDDGKLLVLETQVSGKKKAAQKSAYSTADESNVVSSNMLYAGSILRDGSCYAMVCATGKATLMRQIHGKKGEYLPSLLQNVRNYSRICSIVSMVASFLLILCAVCFQHNSNELFLVSCAIGTLSLCDSLTSVSLLSYADSLIKMSDQKLIPRNQNKVEKLAEVNTVMCSQELLFPPKVIRLSSAVIDGFVYSVSSQPKGLEPLLKMFLACSNYPNVQRDYEKSVVKYLTDECIPMDDLTNEWFYMDEERDHDGEKCAILALHSDHYQTVIKGSPENILSRCIGFELHGKEYRLDENSKKKILAAAEQASRDNGYLIAIASGITVADTLRSREAEKRMIFRGILAFNVHMEVNIANAMFRCNNAKIETLITSTDPYFTVASMGKSIGLIEHEGQMISSAEIRASDYGMYVMNSPRYRIYLDPDSDQWHDVLRIRKSNGRTVAATAESAEELSFLHEADVSIVPMSSSDILRESSDFIMKEPGFHVIADGITNAKALCYRLRWLRQYAVSGFSTAFLILLVSVIFGLPLPFRAQEILFGGIIANLLIATVLAFAPVKRKVLEEPIYRFKGTFSMEELFLPLLYAAGSFASILGVLLLTGNSTCCMLSFVICQFLFACGCLWKKGAIRSKQFGFSQIWFLLAALTLYFVILLLIPGIRMALDFSVSSWASFGIAVGLPILWNAVLQIGWFFKKDKNNK